MTRRALLFALPAVLLPAPVIARRRHRRFLIVKARPQVQTTSVDVCEIAYLSDTPNVGSSFAELWRCRGLP